MKMRMKEEILLWMSACVEIHGERRNKQAKNTPKDDNVKVEEVRNADCEAEDNGYHAGPARVC